MPYKKVINEFIINNKISVYSFGLALLLNVFFMFFSLALLGEKNTDKIQDYYVSFEQVPESKVKVVDVEKLSKNNKNFSEKTPSNAPVSNKITLKSPTISSSVNKGDAVSVSSKDLMQTTTQSVVTKQNPTVHAGEPEKNKAVYFAAVDLMPEPIGGYNNIKSKVNYPEQAKNKGITGKVLIRVYIDELGEVVKTELLKGLGYGCDEVAQNVLRRTRFYPGKQNGKKVKVQMAVPVPFELY